MALTDHLANERTFLAWLRTALAVLAFGFVIERFAFYLQYALNTPLTSSDITRTARLGNALIWIGVGLIPIALWRYLAEAQNIERNLHQPYRVWPIVVLAMLFTGVGLFIAIFLMA